MNITQDVQKGNWSISLMDTTNENDTNITTGGMEKILAMLVLGLGSFLCGMLPTIISDRNRERFPLATSLMLCYGAGILLATSLVHILPEVRSQMNSSWAEISLCGGFFVIYFIDEFVHYFFGEVIQHTHSQHNEIATLNGYGSIANETEPLLHDPSSSHKESTNNGHHHSHSHCNEQVIDEANARICHTSHAEPCSQSISTMGLFAALSLHSAIEGIAIGVQNTSSKVLFLLGAVACHKFVMAFCLGLEFRSNPTTNVKSQGMGIVVFSLGAVCGIGLGMLLIGMSSSILSSSALSIIQGLAGGTLLYVTVCEVIPREKARWHQNENRKIAGIIQFITVALGFVTMVIVNFYMDDDDKA
ncbi:zinc transporter ZIP1-like [Haematobia irritans]|uniref:zinc transporter ZIP1-like n=1 Tax=Haematobia irritans TaxID=7368 RepID=UPI003F4F55C4